MREWKVGVLAAAAMTMMLVAGTVWYVVSPWMTLYGIQRAVERRDVEGMIGYVDFDALRQSLKEQVHAEADRRGEQATPTGWSLPDATGSEAAAVDRQIDTYVTPDTARALLGRMSRDTPDGRPGMGDFYRELAVDREGMSRFVVRSKSGRSGVGVVFAAHGLSWKLAGVRLPVGIGKAEATRMLGW